MESVSQGADRSGQLSRQRQGQLSEQHARRWLEAAGLRFVAANVHYRGGELDLIMRDGRTWVFVEVRYRRNDRYGGAAASVTRTKQRRVRHAAACWLAARGSSLDTVACRFDVVAITGSQFEWLRNAFTAEA